jgi:hypothetical protein
MQCSDRWQRLDAVNKSDVERCKCSQCDAVKSSPHYRDGCWLPLCDDCHTAAHRTTT